VYVCAFVALANGFGLILNGMEDAREKRGDIVSESDNLVLRSLPMDAWAFLIERSVTTGVGAGEVLCRDGKPLTHVVFPQSGVLSVMAASGGNRSTEMVSIGREGFFGVPLLTAAGTCEGDMKMLVSGNVTFVPFHCLNEALAQFSCVRQLLSHFDMFLLKCLMQTVACERNHGAEQRIALWLLTTMKKLQNPAIPITHATLSNLLGLRRATVTTVLAGFVEDGSINAGRGVIYIANAKQLEKRSCECYRKWQNAYSELNKSMIIDLPCS
jgi:CRP-like cAMP-binding protein